jgi:hypothetical protein
MARSAAHLLRELIQNVLDEAASKCAVTVEYKAGRGVYVSVEDDVPGGIRDERLIFTIWMSDKQDQPTKRGRMGRGMKELISVSDWTLIRTVGKAAVEFKRQPGGDWSRSHRGGLARESGTLVEAEVRAWKAKDCAEIIAYVKRIRPPQGIELTVNGEQVKRRPPSETYNMRLPSVTFEIEEGERKESNRQFDTLVELFAEDEPYCYEMGIPIEPIEFPLTIDVGQREPLREKRDTLLSWYKSELFAGLLNKRIAHIPADELKNNYILAAAGADYLLDDATKQRIAHAWTEGKPFATNPLQHSIATGAHVDVISLRAMPEAVRDIVQAMGVNVKDVLAARQPELCPLVPTHVQTTAEIRLVRVWEWIARSIQRPAQMQIRDGKPGAVATFDAARLTLSIQRQEIPNWELWCSQPLKSAQLSLLIHELGHWKVLEHSHGIDYASDVERVGGLVAAFLVAHADEALAMVMP